MTFHLIYNMFKSRQELERRVRYRKSRSAYCCLSLSWIFLNIQARLRLDFQENLTSFFPADYTIYDLTHRPISSQMMYLDWTSLLRLSTFTLVYWKSVVTAYRKRRKNLHTMGFIRKDRLLKVLDNTN